MCLDVTKRVSEPGRSDGKSDGQVRCQTAQRTYLSTLHIRSHTVYIYIIRFVHVTDCFNAYFLHIEHCIMICVAC